MLKKKKWLPSRGGVSLADRFLSSGGISRHNPYVSSTFRGWEPNPKESQSYPLALKKKHTSSSIVASMTPSKNALRLMFLLCLVAARVILANQGANPYNNYQQPAQYSSQQYGQQQHQQQQQQQQQQQRGPPQQPPSGYNPYAPPPSQYSAPPGFGAPPGFAPPPRDSGSQDGGGGLFSKLKNSIMAAGSAITSGLDSNSNPSGYGVPKSMPPGYGQMPPRGNMPPSSRMGPPGYGPPPRSSMGEDSNGPFGLVGKIKNLFNQDEKDDSDQRGLAFGGSPSQSQHRPVPPHMSGPPGYRGQVNVPSVPPSYQGNHNQDNYQQQQQPPPPQQQHHHHQQQQQQQMPGMNAPSEYKNNYDSSNGEYSNSLQTPPIEMNNNELNDNFRSNSQGGPPTGPQSMYTSNTPATNYPSYNQMSHMNPPPPPMPIVPPEPEISPEPQVFTVDDCIVLILKPKEFFRKKSELTRGGAHNLQVFTDFERVLTKFKTDENQRTYGTAELLELSNAILPHAVQQIRDVTDEFSRNDNMDYKAFEDLTTACQNIVAKEGGLHIASVGPVTRDFLPKLPLRDGWKDAFQSLAFKGVPMYIFSSGYGDIVSQALLLASNEQSGRGRGGDAQPRVLPQNVRIISNFFRTAPDGSVRAFSQPVIHEKNKNATSAAIHMGMPIPERPYGLIFGSHEDDISMTDGVLGLQEQLSIGFLEMTEDLPARLNSFLHSYDAVVLGDGSFQYIKTLVDEILQVDSTALSKGKNKPSIFERGLQGLGGVELF